MSRRPNIMKGSRINLVLPADIRTKLDLYLFSEAEGRVPMGAYQQFFVERIQEFFDQAYLDTGDGMVRGSKSTIAKLLTRMGDTQ